MDRKDPGPRDEGASFLALKQTLLLSYCGEICSYAAAKGRGEALGGGGAAGRLVELRTVMEKLRPMDRCVCVCPSSIGVYFCLCILYCLSICTCSRCVTPALMLSCSHHLLFVVL